MSRRFYPHLCRLDIRRCADFHDQIAVLVNQLVHVADVVHGRPIPNRNRATGRGQTATMLRQFAVPLGNNQAVNHDQIVVQISQPSAHLMVLL